jgi:hypothetical protein
MDVCVGYNNCAMCGCSSELPSIEIDWMCGTEMCCFCFGCFGKDCCISKCPAVGLFNVCKDVSKCGKIMCKCMAISCCGACTMPIIHDSSKTYIEEMEPGLKELIPRQYYINQKIEEQPPIQQTMV